MNFMLLPWSHYLSKFNTLASLTQVEYNKVFDKVVVFVNSIYFLKGIYMNKVSTKK